MPHHLDDFTLLKKYHEEWCIYREQAKFLPGPFKPVEEESQANSDIGKGLDL